MKQMRKVVATVYLVKVTMRWKIWRAPMMALTMLLSPGLVSTMSAAPLAASVAPEQPQCGSVAALDSSRQAGQPQHCC